MKKHHLICVVTHLRWNDCCLTGNDSYTIGMRIDFQLGVIAVVVEEVRYLVIIKIAL